MKSYLTSLFWGFFCFQSAMAGEDLLSDNYLGSREGDPDSFVENVSTIHGDYTEIEVDLTVPSPDPLVLSRFYSSRDTIEMATFGGWRFNPHCFLTIRKDPKGKTYTTAEGKFEKIYVHVGNPEGAILTYVGEQNTANVSKPSVFKIDPEEESIGLCNTAKGNISSWTNLKNNELHFNPRTDSFELILSTEGRRFYAKHPSSNLYLITHEILPSGNKVFYEFNEQGQLSLIKETNASEKKILAWIKLEYGKHIHVETSDGKTAEYHFQQDPSGIGLLTTVERSNKPLVQYQYRVIDHHPLLIKKVLPEGRFVELDYYADPVHQHKVKSVAIPADSNRMANTHFFYEKDCTKVERPGNNKAVYRFNGEKQLVAIEQYLDGVFYRAHTKTWGTGNNAGNLISSAMEDCSGRVVHQKMFRYDDKNIGNIVEEREYGNLTGADSALISVSEEKGPNSKAHIKMYWYFSDENTYGFFQKDEKRTGLKCCYKKGTNLLIEKFILSKGIVNEEGEELGAQITKRYFYDYNEDGVLIRTVVDDGDEKEKRSTENVSERHIVVISPKQELPNIGAPKIIEEKYLDAERGKEILLRKTVNQFDAEGLIVSQAIYDANGSRRYTLKRGYTDGLLSFETDPIGNETHYAYDANQNLTQISRLNAGMFVEYGYDLGNRLIHTLEKDKLGNQFETRISYDLAGCKNLEIDRFGNETTYINDSLGRPIQITYPETSDGPRSSTRPTYQYTYDIFDHLLSVTDPEGRDIQAAFNFWGSPTAIQYLDGSQELFKYDREGNLHRYLGRDGLIEVFEYDYVGRLSNVKGYERGSVGAEEGYSKNSYSYNAFHLISEKDANREGTNYAYDYDKAGRLVTISKGDQKIDLIYDPLSRIHKIKTWQSPKAFKLEVKEYDLLNRVTEEQTQNSRGQILVRTRYVYNDAGQLAQIISYPQNRESVMLQYEYDSFNRPSKIVGASAQTLLISYDDAHITEWGQKAHKRVIVDPLGNQTEEVFDTSGHLIKIAKRDKTGGLLSEIESSYDLLENKVLEKAARISLEGLLNPYETGWFFNQENQLESVTRGKGTLQEQTTYFGYNSYGDLASKYQYGSGEPTHYRYNTYGELEAVSYKEQGRKEHQLFYNAIGNITEMRLSSAQVLTYSYNANNLPLSETIKDKFGSYQVKRFYDGDGNIQALELPDGSFVHYDYEGPFVKKVSRLNKGKKEHYSYRIISRDQMGNVLEELLPAQSGKRKQTWDQSGRRTGVSTDFFQDEAEYDLLGHIRKRAIVFEDKKTILEYGYNALSQLIFETGGVEHRYSYDSLGNRLEKDGSIYKVDDLNELIEGENVSYAFDENGNLETKTIGEKRWVYHWNPLNQLTSVKDPEQNTISFTYDLSGRRLTKKTAFKNETPKILRFFYLGNTEIGSLDEKGAIVELKIPSNPNHPENLPSVAIEIRKEIYVPLYDLQGSITCLVDHQKHKVVESYRYSSFGEERIVGENGQAAADSVVGNPWRYCNKRVDIETGLSCFGQRYYDAQVGRWISPDPAGDIDGPNLYVFNRNNPMIHADYFGLASEVNENKSKEFIEYFYGEYNEHEPRCPCEIHRDCQRGGDIGIADYMIDFILNSPRVQGAFQTLGGLAEAGVGAGMALVTGGAAAPFGWPVMAHGLDHVITGGSTVFTGRPRDSATSQLLQKTGMSHRTAGFIDSGLSIGGTAGAAAGIRLSQRAAFPNFYLPGISGLKTIDPNAIRFSQNSIRNTFRNGLSIDDLANSLKNGSISIGEIPPIRLVERDNILYTLDNRRLEAFRRAGLRIPYRMATAEEIAAEAQKFSSTNSGISVQIRGNK